MKLLLSFACIALLAANVFADPNSAAMALARKVAAKSTQAANQTDETPQPAPAHAQPVQPAPPPPNPVLQATLQNITAIRADLVALGGSTDTNSTAVLKMSLLNDLAAAAQGSKPSQQSVTQLGEHLTAAIAGNKDKWRAPQQRLAQELHASFNGAHLTDAQQKMIFDDVPKILASTGTTADDATNIVNDLKAIVTETKEAK